MNWTLDPSNFLVLMLLASGPLFPPIEWWRFRLPTIGGLPKCSAPMFPLCFLLFYVYLFPMPTFAFVISWFIHSHDPLTVPIVYQLFTHSLSPLFLSCFTIVLFVRATLPNALNMMNASSVGKLVQLVTASRLILNHEGQVDPMKDECHYQIKH